MNEQSVYSIASVAISLWSIANYLPPFELMQTCISVYVCDAVQRQATTAMMTPPPTTKSTTRGCKEWKKLRKSMATILGSASQTSCSNMDMHSFSNANVNSSRTHFHTSMNIVWILYGPKSFIPIIYICCVLHFSVIWFGAISVIEFNNLYRSRANVGNVLDAEGHWHQERRGWARHAFFWRWQWILLPLGTPQHEDRCKPIQKMLWIC